MLVCRVICMYKNDEIEDVYVRMHVCKYVCMNIVTLQS